MEIVGSRNINNVDIRIAEHFFVRTVTFRDMIGLCKFFGPAFRTAGYRHHFRIREHFHRPAKMISDGTGADNTKTTN